MGSRTNSRGFDRLRFTANESDRLGIAGEVLRHAAEYQSPRGSARWPFKAINLNVVQFRSSLASTLT